MRTSKEYPSQAGLNELFFYHDGRLYWKSRPSNCVDIKKPAGRTRKDGYTEIQISGKLYYLHRLIYILFNGAIPQHLIVDHRDGNPRNNAIANLQAITVKQNTTKKNKSKNNTSGYKGVFFHKLANKWCSQITVNGRTLHLGLYTCSDDAAAAYDKAALEYFGEFTQLNFPDASAIAAE